MNASPYLLYTQFTESSDRSSLPTRLRGLLPLSRRLCLVSSHFKEDSSKAFIDDWDGQLTRLLAT
jgi:hypothetical protein